MSTDRKLRAEFNRFTAELRSPTLEAAYRRDRFSDSIKQIRIACIVIGFYLIGLQVIDLVSTGISREFFNVLAVRTVILSVFSLLYMTTFVDVHFRLIEWCMTASHFTFSIGVCVILWLEPIQANAAILNLAMVTLAMFILLPGRFLWIIITAAIGMGLVAIIISQQNILVISEVARLFVVGSIAQALGAAGCYRIKRLRRIDFIRMQKEREINTELRKEIDARHEREKQVSRSEQAFRDLFNLAPVPLVLLKSDDYELIHGNNAFARLVGFQDTSSTYFQAYRVFHDRKTAESFHKDIVEFGEVENREINLKRMDGREVSVLASCFFMTFEGRGAVMMSLTDITAQVQNQKKLEALASTDPLTSVGNRRHFMAQAKDMAAYAQRYHAPFSLLAMDIDHFKRINDTHGHDVGDTVLIAVTNLVKETLRAPDLVGRIGGEEFAMALPQTPEAEADLVANRIRAAIEAHEIQVNDISLKVTVSIGVAEMELSMEGVADTLRRADKALYVAKHSGRNSVERAPSLRPI